jgi:predicted nucleotidyltransferase
MIELIHRHRDDLADLCRRYAVRSLEVFGSAADGSFDPARSDLDFLVEFRPEAAARPFHGFFDLRDDLAKLFGRKVDLVMPAAIRNPRLRTAVDRQRTPLYGA